MAQMKPPACQFKPPRVDNDLTLPHDYSSFIQRSLRWEDTVLARGSEAPLKALGGAGGFSE